MTQESKEKPVSRWAKTCVEIYVNVMVLSEVVTAKPHTSNGVRGRVAPESHYTLYIAFGIIRGFT
jgi:hypothetical protein